MDPDVYCIPTAAEVIAMLHSAAFGDVDHQPGDGSNHDTDLFLTRLER
jgi:hypothetical protein